MSKKEKVKVAAVVAKLMKAADMLMGEATGGRPVQDWGLVNTAMCEAAKLVADMREES